MSIEEAYVKIIADEFTQVDESFKRLPAKTIGNDLWAVNRALKAFTDTQLNGNDVNEDQLDNIIKTLQKIKKDIKVFKNPEDVPLDYLYDSGNKRRR